MGLLLRVDDFPGTKPEEFNNHNLTNYKKFHESLQKHGIRYVLGVIPLHSTLNDLKWLSNQDDIIVALHGVFHNESYPDEFHGKDYSYIVNTLSMAQQRLEVTLGYPVVDYIPPHNTINVQTVVALQEIGFKRIYGGPETDEVVKNFILGQGLEYIHSEPPLEYGRSDELMERGSIEHLTKKCPETDIYLTLHWTWEHNIGLNYLGDYLSRLSGLWKKSV